MKALFLFLSLFSFAVTSLNLNVAHAQIVEGGEVPFTAHVKLDYQVGIAAYLTALDQKLDFELGKVQDLVVNIKNTNRHTLLLVTVVSYDKDNNALNIVITREDFRNDKSYAGYANKVSFRHVIGNGTSVVRIKGQDPLTSGPFRFKFDF